MSADPQNTLFQIGYLSVYSIGSSQHTVEIMPFSERLKYHGFRLVNSIWKIVELKFSLVFYDSCFYQTRNALTI